MTATELSDDNFINFQDDFYNLLEKYGVSSIDIEHPQFETICNLRNSVVEFIEQELFEEEEYRETDGTTKEEV
jgi:purine-nucleoside phosphorylase